MAKMTEVIHPLGRFEVVGLSKAMDRQAKNLMVKLQAQGNTWLKIPYEEVDEGNFIRVWYPIEGNTLFLGQVFELALITMKEQGDEGH